jgi:Phage major capsid protein E
MGISHLHQLQTPALGLTVKEVLNNAVPTFTDTILPNGESFDRRFAYEVLQKHKHIAAMVGYDSEPPIVDHPTVSKMILEVAKLGLKNIYTEEDLLALETPRNEDEREQAIAKVLKKNVDLIEALKLRIDTLKLEAILKGSLTYDQNGVKLSIDYGVPASNKLTSDWVDTEHDIIGDIEAWVTKYADMNNESPSAVILPKEVVRLLSANEGIKAEVDHLKRTRLKDEIKPFKEMLQMIFNDYGFPKIEFLDRTSVTVRDPYTGKDIEVSYALSNRVVLVADNIGEVVFGPTVENGFMPGYKLHVYDNIEPVQSVQRAVVAALPVVKHPNLIMYCDVTSTPAP